MPGWLWAVPPENYPVFVKTQTFAIRRVGRAALERIRPGDTLYAYLSGSKVLAGMFEAVGTAFRDTTPLVAGGSYPHRIRVRPVVALSEEAYVPYDAFSDKLDVVREYPDFRSVVQQVIHPLPKVDEKVLAFLVRVRQPSDLEQVLQAYNAYLEAREDRTAVAAEAPEVREEAPAYRPQVPFDRGDALERLIRYIEGRGFVYEPWQVAAYVTALRTKPFVILAGVTGTGKSKLPALVAEGSGGQVRLVPVRPDWTDSAEVLGYIDLQGRFRPGAVLQAARAAMEAPEQHLTCILDEMNLARVEQYFAEVLSRIEDRRPVEGAGAGFRSAPLLGQELHPSDATWAGVYLPTNFALVGTVNMDESAHAFSRKVLDRAFTLELADLDLQAWEHAQEGEAPEPARWPVEAWVPRALRPGAIERLSGEERTRVERVVDVLAAANTFLSPAQVQVAYRTRDEVALFVLHAEEVREAFRTRSGAEVDPLDLVLKMKVLPRLMGGSPPLRRAVLHLLGWAVTGEAFEAEEEGQDVLERWDELGRPSSLPEARFPRTAARLCLMWERLLLEGYTSFWI